MILTDSGPLQRTIEAFLKAVILPEQETELAHWLAVLEQRNLACPTAESRATSQKVDWRGWLGFRAPLDNYEGLNQSLQGFRQLVSTGLQYEQAYNYKAQVLDDLDGFQFGKNVERFHLLANYLLRYFLYVIQDLITHCDGLGQTGALPSVFLDQFRQACSTILRAGLPLCLRNDRDIELAQTCGDQNSWLSEKKGDPYIVRVSFFNLLITAGSVADIDARLRVQYFFTLSPLHADSLLERRFLKGDFEMRV